MRGAELFIVIIFLIPIYGLLIWGYIDPKASILFGERWMYKEEPEYSEEILKFIKLLSIIGIIFTTFWLILSIYQTFK